MVKGRGYPYGCPHPITIYMDINPDIHVGVRAQISLLRTVRPRRNKSTKTSAIETQGTL